MKSVPIVKLALSLAFLAGIGAYLLHGDVRTNRRPVNREYHGTRITDDFAWLENGTNPVVRKWTEAQNTEARNVLDASPARRPIAAALKELTEATGSTYSALTYRGGKLFLLRFTPPQQQAVLVTLDSPDDLKSERVLVDPNTLDPSGGTSIDWFVPSHDGRSLAVCLSSGGSEEGTLHVFDVASRTRLADAIPRVQRATAGGSAVWNADNTGIFYTRYPAPGERPASEAYFFQQVYFHALGTDVASDRYEIGKDFPRIAEIELSSSPDGRQVLAKVANGDGGEFAHFLRGDTGQWNQLAGFADGVQRLEFGRDSLYIELPPDQSLYALSIKGAPNGRILQLPAGRWSLDQAHEILAETTNALIAFKPTASGLALVYARGATHQFVYRDFFNATLNGPSSRSEKPDFRIPTSVQEMLVTRGDEILIKTETYTAPFTWWRFDANRSRESCEATALKGHSAVRFTDVEAVIVSVESKDGTRVPMTLVQRKGTRRDGQNPVLLYGYGGFGIGLSPEFDATRRLWIDQGGVYAVAHLRGGNEFGARWHADGMLTRKQNVFDDFAACARWLVATNYTQSSLLAIEGGSNGGLLMGATLTQQPNLARVAIAHVGLYDMLRAETDPNGQFNVTEFGSTADPTQFQTLLAYSPYHAVRPNTPYPAVLFLTGENDGRVNPAHSRKMTAQLQASSTSKWPILLRTSSSTGHGHGTSLSEHLEQVADVYTFLFDQLGIDYSLIQSGPWSGGIQPDAAIVNVRLARPGLQARLLLSKDTNWSRAKAYGPITARSDYDAAVSFGLSRLDPNTRYHYALEIDGRLETRRTGQFQTLPRPGPASFQFAFASCGRTGSTRDVYDRVREHQPLFFLHMGDFQYLDIQTNDIQQFRAAYDQVLASPQQGDLYRQVPLVYMWDDHDYGGNSATKKSKTHEAVRRAYEEFVPHYPLARQGSGDPIYHAFTVGRVRFIITDLRSERDDPKKKDTAAKSMMGETQKAWFKKELLAAKEKYPLTIWMSSVPWIGTAGHSPYARLKSDIYGYIHHTNTSLFNYKTNKNGTLRPPEIAPGEEDHWAVFSTERHELADFIQANNIRSLCIIHGDSHMLAADDGSNADFSSKGGMTIPVMCAAPLEQNPSLKGGPYSQGVYRVHDSKGEGAFGLLSIQDDGSRLHVQFSGRNNKDEEKISLEFDVANGVIQRAATSPGIPR